VASTTVRQNYLALRSVLIQGVHCSHTLRGAQQAPMTVELSTIVAVHCGAQKAIGAQTAPHSLLTVAGNRAGGIFQCMWLIHSVWDNSFANRAANSANVLLLAGIFARASVLCICRDCVANCPCGATAGGAFPWRRQKQPHTHTTPPLRRLAAGLLARKKRTQTPKPRSFWSSLFFGD